MKLYFTYMTTVVFLWFTCTCPVIPDTTGEEEPSQGGQDQLSDSKRCSADGQCSNDREQHEHEEESAEDGKMRYTKGDLQHDATPLVPKDKKPIMIWWTDHIFPHEREQQTHEIYCQKGGCLVSINKTLRHDASTRAYLFYGTDLRADELPLPRQPWDEWALFHEESPKNNWMLSHEDAISMFNHTATFRRESDYSLATHYIKDVQDWISTPEVPVKEKNRLQKEKGFASVVYLQRDCWTPSDRESYMEELMKHMKIDSYGPCLNNKKMPEEIDGFIKLHSSVYYEFLSQYKFHIAFENAVCNDYMTEKLFRPLEVGSVPIVFGSPVAKDWIPNEKSAIFIDDFESPKELSEYLKYLDSNDDKYEEYFSHRQPGGITNQFLLDSIKNRQWKILGEWDKPNFGHRMYTGFECHVCDRIYERQQALRAHQLNPDKIPPPPPRIGKQNHLGCPEPKVKIQTGKDVNKSVNYWEGLYEARAFKTMLLAKETDTTRFMHNYLKRTTDKYDRYP